MSDHLKIAIVCDWLTVFAGAERVILEMHNTFPDAEIYTSIYDKASCPQFAEAKVKASFLNKIPFAKRFHRLFLPFMPMAFEAMDFSSYDVVISSSHSMAKGVITGPETLHISYCHSPPRYLWDESHQYIKDQIDFAPFRMFFQPILHRIRMWDRIASSRVDIYLSNSKHVSQRIKKYYGRESTVLNPPINLKGFHSSEKRENYMLAVGRLTAYKRFDLSILACEALNQELIVVGDGPELKRLRGIAGPNTRFLGRVSESELQDLYSKASALIFPQVEDFGIVPLEAMASGCPVLAYGKGGILDSLLENVNGLFFREQNLESLKKGLLEMKKTDWNHDAIVNSVSGFSSARFKAELFDFVSNAHRR